MWRVCCVHVSSTHAKRPEACRETQRDFFGLMLRDRVDIISGDFNQGFRLLGEALTNVVRLHHSRGGPEVRWAMSAMISIFHRRR